MIIIIKQNRLAVTVNAFFSVKYFFMISGLAGGFYTRRNQGFKYRMGKDFMLLIIDKKVKNFGQYNPYKPWQ